MTDDHAKSRAWGRLMEAADLADEHGIGLSICRWGVHVREETIKGTYAMTVPWSDIEHNAENPLLRIVTELSPIKLRELSNAG